MAAHYSNRARHSIASYLTYFIILYPICGWLHDLLYICKYIAYSSSIITLMIQKAFLTFYFFLSTKNLSNLFPPPSPSLSLIPFQILLVVRNPGPSLPWVQAISLYTKPSIESQGGAESFNSSGQRWLKLVIPALRSLRQEDRGWMDARLVYVSGHLQINK